MGDLKIYEQKYEGPSFMEIPLWRLTIQSTSVRTKGLKPRARLFIKEKYEKKTN